MVSITVSPKIEESLKMEGGQSQGPLLANTESTVIFNTLFSIRCLAPVVSITYLNSETTLYRTLQETNLALFNSQYIKIL